MTVHDTFVIERRYPVPPEEVFAAFADPAAKSRWTDSATITAVPDAGDDYLEFDFRVGGHERFAFGRPGDRVYAYDAVYADIVPGARIVYCYQLRANDALASVSVTTVELAAVPADAAAPAGTALTYTEQGVFLDGIDDPAERREGMTELLDNLAGYLAATY